MGDTNEWTLNREGGLKLAQSRVTSVEKYYGLFCETLGSVIRKSARLRNKNDVFAHHLKEYAETEKLSSSTRTSLLRIAENFSAVQDYRNTEIQRLEARALKPLMKYGELCKNMKSSIKENQIALTREKKQSVKLKKLEQKVPPSPLHITKAQADLQKLKQQTGVHEEQLLVEMDQFERHKLSDMKTVLCEFVQIEMMFHARALEYLSRCYEAAQQIETEADMEHFRVALLEATGQSQISGTAYSQSAIRGAVFQNAYSQSLQTRTQSSMYNDVDDSDDEEGYTDEDDES